VKGYNMEDTQAVEFQAEDGSLLKGTWGRPGSAARGFPVVVLATGDGPNGSRGETWQNLVPLLNGRGIATFLFDFAGLGDSPGTYEDLTLTRGCRDFRAALDYVTSNGNHNRDRIGVIGSSFGGNVALLEAASFPQIKAVGLKSASTFMPEGYEIELGHEAMARWGTEGYSDETKHTYDIVLDALFHNTYKAASTINAPVRIVHGTADSSVPIRHARDLLKVLKNGSILEIAGADHWYAEGDEWQQMADDLVSFMVRELRPDRNR
jgi:dipeptidyl aminopeptidase/acylaminoacyl peptidase